MKIYLRRLAALACSLCLLSCNDKQESKQQKAEVKNVTQSQKGNFAILSGQINYTKHSDAFIHKEEASGEEKIEIDNMVNMVSNMAKEISLMPEIALLLDGNSSTPSATVESFYKNVLGNMDIVLEFSDLGYEKNNGIITQKTGSVSMQATQAFMARRYTVNQPINSPALDIELQRAAFKNIVLTLQDGINNEQMLRATIAHELGHLFFEYKYPAIAHSDKLTAEGYVEGKAASEGAALLVEQAYLRKHYNYAVGNSIFKQYHPVNNPNAPYGNYAAYFRDNFCETIMFNGKKYLMFNNEVLLNRNNIIVSEIITQYAQNSKDISGWTTKPAYLRVIREDRVSIDITGYFRQARVENSATGVPAKTGEVSHATSKLVNEIIEQEKVALQINNKISQYALTSLFSKADRVNLQCTTSDNGISSLSSEVLALFIANKDTDFTARAPKTSKQTTPSLLYLSLIKIADQQPDYHHILTSKPKLAQDELIRANKKFPHLTRKGTIIHELSHLYFARIAPTTDDAIIREGYAMFAEYCYYINHLSANGYTQDKANNLASQYMEMKYKSSKTVSPDLIDASNRAYVQFIRFMKQYLIPDTMMVDMAKIQLSEQISIKQKYQYMQDLLKLPQAAR